MIRHIRDASWSIRPRAGRTPLKPHGRACRSPLAHPSEPLADQDNDTTPKPLLSQEEEEYDLGIPDRPQNSDMASEKDGVSDMASETDTKQPQNVTPATGGGWVNAALCVAAGLSGSAAAVASWGES